MMRAGAYLKDSEGLLVVAAFRLLHPPLLRPLFPSLWLTPSSSQHADQSCQVALVD